jgi:hypothetical protein
MACGRADGDMYWRSFQLQTTADTSILTATTNVPFIALI